MEDFLSLDKQLCFAVYETSSEFNKLYTSVLQPFGLTYPQYLVLLALWEKDEVTVKELGEKLNLGTGTLTPMIARMSDNDWLRKERSKTDERKVHIYLQPKAIQEQQAITQKIKEEILSCHINLQEYEQLLQQLKILQNKLKKRKGKV
ncbi:MarR family winged helix-turn-helix transcriptional regulator [Niallia endozanthoxylica]|uniref:HTH-type transcriptional regulator SarZ n=1 Tax=Niallia endozanthoxylica TaxID=2036016 RepID=A0A5J5HMY7_9BACI|nr:MarR family transcriptional regulator [Niallia endozanthoxylica]KAA9021582.1 MarR family transcriptional regulator [Niallia endozanthoxylica]